MVNVRKIARARAPCSPGAVGHGDAEDGVVHHQRRAPEQAAERAARIVLQPRRSAALLDLNDRDRADLSLCRAKV